MAERKKAPKKKTAKKKLKPGSKDGRPTKLTEDLKKKLEFLYDKGFSDKEVAFSVGITDKTLDNWKKKHPQFFRSVMDWKARADRKVVKSLYERALGYSHPEEKIFCNNGEIISEETVKHYPPDVGAIKMWLYNRKNKDWKPERVTGDLTVKSDPDNPVEFNFIIDGKKDK